MPKTLVIEDIGTIPEVAEARGKLVGVQLRLSQLEKEINGVHLKIADSEEAERRRDKRRDQVEALLDGGAMPEQADLRRNLQSLEAERGLVYEAVALAKQRVKLAEQRVGKDFCERVKSDYAKVVQAECLATIAQLKAVEARIAEEDKYTGAGHLWRGALQPTRFAVENNPTQRFSAFARGVADAAAAGHLSAAWIEEHIPASWRKGWGKPLPWESDKYTSPADYQPTISAGPDGIQTIPPKKQMVAAGVGADGWSGGGVKADGGIAVIEHEGG